MDSSNTLIASLIWGSVGLGFAVYGKRQGAPVPLFGGIALVALSYFLNSALSMCLVGGLVVACMVWLIRRGN
jgi:hypothetical protein